MNYQKRIKTISLTEYRKLTRHSKLLLKVKRLIRELREMTNRVNEKVEEQVDDHYNQIKL